MAEIVMSTPRRQSRGRRVFTWLVMGIVALCLVGLSVLIVWAEQTAQPTRLAPAGATELVIVGGLKRPFPPMMTRPDNPTTAERVALGKLLYFDPLLSGDNTMACATCHHPDLGFADGRGLSMGKGGQGLGPARKGGETTPRGAPSVWNAAFYHKQFWDGRAVDLEDQARSPITAANEMAEDPDRLVFELKANAEYVSLFDRAFGGQGGSGVTFDNVTKAIAAFERTLVSDNAPYDRYAAGNVTALTPAQRRGLNLFRSTQTRCFECHGFPTFANPDFKVIGVPDLPGMEPDLGRAKIEGGAAYERAFKVPTLRNIALTAPYMHNGIFATLEDVVDFYSKGGGVGRGLKLTNLDDKIRPFTLTTDEKSDLIAFLHSLTDESRLPDPPTRLPSGLPIPPRLPRTTTPATTSSPPTSPGSATQPPHTHRVAPGGSIQAAVDQARHGDTIVVAPGVYQETVSIDLDRLTLRGEIVNGQRPILDGQGQRRDGALASGNDFVIEGFEVRHYTGNGVIVHGAKNVTFRDLKVDDTGLYGIYPVECDGVLVDGVRVTGAKDAGIYVGQSRNIVVRNSEATANVTGIEIENSVNAVVENNWVHGNTGGILVFLLPNNPSKFGHHTRVVGNRIEANNLANFADPAAIVANVPQGTGILIMAADHTEVTDNAIRDNDSVGVAVISLNMLFPKGATFDVDPTPEENWIHDNTISGNGKQPAGIVRQAGLPGADLLWDASGWNNRWRETGVTAFPPALPGPPWPQWVSKVWWRVLSVAREKL